MSLSSLVPPFPPEISQTFFPIPDTLKRKFERWKEQARTSTRPFHKRYLVNIQCMRPEKRHEMISFLLYENIPFKLLEDTLLFDVQSMDERTWSAFILGYEELVLG